MRRYRGLFALLVFAALCAGGVWLSLEVTAEYPALGEPVSYPVNQIDGFELAIDEPSWSPFKGYTIKWKVTADSEELYTFSIDGNGNEPDFSYLERLVDGQWHRLGYTQEEFVSAPLEFSLGDENTELEGSIVQKYDHCGTRLEPGNYRVTLRMIAEDGTAHYLAAEFMVDQR